MLSSSPNRNLVDDSCNPRSLFSVATFRATIEQPSYGIFAWVSWLNIGLVAAGPAEPAPTALSYSYYPGGLERALLYMIGY